MRSDLHAVILAGGAGTRFWPLSRRNRPKPFLPLIAGTTLLRHTWERILTLCPAERIRVVANREHGEAIRQMLPELSGDNLLLEPMGRNTAAAIALGAVAIQRSGGDCPVLIAPIDHRVDDPAAFRTAVDSACREGAGRLIAFGVPPDGPRTGYGYLVAGPNREGTALRSVRHFVEKPDRNRAAELLQQDGVFWNTGIFLWSVDTILASIRKHLPALGNRLADWEVILKSGQIDRLAESYQNLDAISIDHGVLERADNVSVLPARFGWRDIGTWESYGETLPDAGAGNRAAGRLVAIDSTGNTIHHPEGETGLIGVENLVVVYHDGELLVCRKDRTEEVRELENLVTKEKKEKSP